MAFELETVDQLPEGGRAAASQYNETIEAFIRAVNDGTIPANKWTVLKVGDNRESIAATTSGLKDKYGPMSASGLAFAARPYHKDGKLRAIYVTYDPSKIVEGHRAKHEETRAAKLKAANERAKARKAEKDKKAAEAGPTSGNTEGSANANVPQGNIRPEGKAKAQTTPQEPATKAS